MYQNPHQYFCSEREFLLGALIGKMSPVLSLNFPTLVDIFKIKESGSKFKTKAQKLAFIQQISENLKALPYNSFQLNKIKNFLRKKSAEYKVIAPKIEVDANFVRHAPRICQCKDCHEIKSQSISNTILNAYGFVKGLEEAMMCLKIPMIKDLFANLQKIQCPIAKQTFSNVILDKAIEFCTNASDFYLDDSSLFVFQYNLGNKNLSIQFDKNQVKIFTN